MTLARHVSARQAYPLYYDLATPFVQLRQRRQSGPRAQSVLRASAAQSPRGLLTWLVAAITRSLIRWHRRRTAARRSLTRSGRRRSSPRSTRSISRWSRVVLIAPARLGVSTRRDRRLVRCCARSMRSPSATISRRFCCSSRSSPSWPTAHPTSAAAAASRASSRPALLIAAIGVAAVHRPTCWRSGRTSSHRPRWTDRLATFWFDVTKADWRATMILGVPAGKRHRSSGDVALGCPTAVRRRSVWPSPSLGAIALWWRSRPWAVLVVGAPTSSTRCSRSPTTSATPTCSSCPDTSSRRSPPAPALPVITAEAAQRALSVASAAHAALRQALAAAALLAYVGWRGWDDVAGRRIGTTTGAANSSPPGVRRRSPNRHALLVARMNWDQENALLYAGRYLQPAVPWVRLYEVLPHFPYLVRDNFAIGRDIVLTADAAARVSPHTVRSFRSCRTMCQPLRRSRTSWRESRAVHPTFSPCCRHCATITSMQRTSRWR